MNPKRSQPVSDSKDPDDRAPVADPPERPGVPADAGPDAVRPAAPPLPEAAPLAVPEDELALEVDRAQRELEAALAELREVARARLSPGRALQAHLGLALAAGFAFGLVLGLRGR